MQRTKPPADLKPGDVVVLKSGGPRMTVEEIETNGRAKVCWFDDKKNVQRATFETHMLEAVADDEPSSLEIL